MDDILTRAYAIAVTSHGEISLEDARAMAVRQMAADAKATYSRNRCSALAAVVVTALAVASCAVQTWAGVLP